MQTPPVDETVIQNVAITYMQLVSGLWQNYALICVADPSHRSFTTEEGKLAFLNETFTEMLDRAENTCKGWIGTLEVPEKAKEVLSLTGDEDDDRQAIAYFMNVTFQILRPFQVENITAIAEAQSASDIYAGLMRKAQSVAVNVENIEEAKNATAEGVLTGALEILSQII